MSPTTWLPATEYYKSLPKLIAGAGIALHDAVGRFLLVQPRYRADTWEIPGGGLDAGEHPMQAAAREVVEELGIALTPGRLLVVDWVPAQPDGRPPLANFVFDGGTVSESWAHEHVRLDTGELAQWRFADAVECEALLIPLLARRLAACANSLTSGTTAYLYEGRSLAAPASS